jgi:DTW domain-containing protein YfiP
MVTAGTVVVTDSCSLAAMMYWESEKVHVDTQFLEKAGHSSCSVTMALSEETNSVGLLADDESDDLESYLRSFETRDAIEKQKQWSRQLCCGKSRSLYCPECYSLLFPPSEWPKDLKKLPFDLYIILHDRRAVATGVHAKVLHKSICLAAGAYERDVEIFDLERLDPLPKNFPEHSYLLFPSDDSVPLDSVKRQVKTLVVLDCKWTRSSSREDPRLASLPRVHLTRPHRQSFFWRWHSAGSERLSSIEAIYEAASEVQSSVNWLDWMRLFALQRAAAGLSQEDKLMHHQFRRQAGTDKQKRDKERGKLLSFQHKKDHEAGLTRNARKPQWKINLEETEAMNDNG